MFSDPNTGGSIDQSAARKMNLSPGTANHKGYRNVQRSNEEESVFDVEKRSRHAEVEVGLCFAERRNQVRDSAVSDPN
jgi:hypothetical protein